MGVYPASLVVGAVDYLQVQPLVAFVKTSDALPRQRVTLAFFEQLWQAKDHFCPWYRICEL